MKSTYFISASLPARGRASCHRPPVLQPDDERGTAQKDAGLQARCCAYSAELGDQTAQDVERGLGRVIVAQDAEPVEQVVPGTVRVAEGEQLPVRDVQVGAQGVYGADDPLQNDRL